MDTSGLSGLQLGPFSSKGSNAGTPPSGGQSTSQAQPKYGKPGSEAKDSGLSEDGIAEQGREGAAIDSKREEIACRALGFESLFDEQKNPYDSD